MTKNIILAGVGGQGILFAAKIIAAAAELAGYQVTTNEIHGMAQRGGSVTAQVRFGDELHSPLFPEGEADVLYSLEAAEAVRFAHFLKPGGLAVVSTQRIIPVTVSSGKAVYPEDVEQRLRSVFANLNYLDCGSVAGKLGDPRLANSVMLGALSAPLELPSESWRKAFERSVKPQLVESNIKAFQAGMEA